jgi:hypothetical protein
LAQAILPGESEYGEVGRAAGRGFSYFLLPLFVIWSAEADSTPLGAERLLQAMGWMLMGAPAIAGIAWWVLR